MWVSVPEDAVDGVSGAARARLHADDMVAWQSQSQSRYLFSDGLLNSTHLTVPTFKARCRSPVTTN